MQEIHCQICEHKNHIEKFFCGNCGAILPPTNIDFFTRLDLSNDYNLDMEKLENNYLNLQKIFHPDLFVSKSELEKSFALKHSLLINEAYETLKKPLKRSQYILKLNDIHVNSEHENALKPDPLLLAEILEYQEEIDEAEERTEIIENLKNEIKEIEQDIGQAYLEKNLQHAASKTLRLQFFKKLLNHAIN